MAKFADAATEAREAREAAQRRDKEFEEWDVKTYEKYVMRSEPNGVESVDGRITWATEAEKRRPKIPLAEHDKLIVSTHHQSIWERLQSFYGRFCLLDLFWAINVLYALEEYFYTSNAIEFVRTRKEYLRKIKSAKAALNALRSDQLFLSSFNMRRLFHKSPKEISRRELRDISRFERNIHDVDNFAEMYEAAHATPLMRRNDPHLKEQLFVFRLSRANRHVTAVLHEIASPKSRAIYELMTLPGIDHCYDQDHIDLLCAKAGGKK
jgi:hypothetical protein